MAEARCKFDIVIIMSSKAGAAIKVLDPVTSVVMDNNLWCSKSRDI